MAVTMNCIIFFYVPNYELVRGRIHFVQGSSGIHGRAGHFCLLLRIITGIGRGTSLERNQQENKGVSDHGLTMSSPTGAAIHTNEYDNEGFGIQGGTTLSKREIRGYNNHTPWNYAASSNTRLQQKQSMRLWSDGSVVRSLLCLDY
ncbi:hypothetical protein J6590_073073 [Homalodisca vitripennis]|nr:hypothetical protein J6590_073073 [Homalodisca vitripennis]